MPDLWLLVTQHAVHRFGNSDGESVRFIIHYVFIPHSFVEGQKFHLVASLLFFYLPHIQGLFNKKMRKNRQRQTTNNKT